MTPQLLNLLNLLEDEFRQSKDIRISPVFPAKTERSPDLPQDYDPESANVHRVTGVRILVRNREFFFPENWMSESPRHRIHTEIEKIRELLN
jgi:hypothetical protein